jgi:ABC-type long-subunit fatty acid transport system fused permease/ATPase subunit
MKEEENIYLETSRFILVSLRLMSVLQKTIDQERFTCHEKKCISKQVEDYRQTMQTFVDSRLWNRISSNLGSNQRLRELMSRFSDIIENLCPMLDTVSFREVDCDAEGHVC